MSKEQDLLPCPFCGGPGDYRNVQDWHGVGCLTRHCPGQRSALHHRTASAAYSAWNHRAALASPAAEPVKHWCTNCMGVDPASCALNNATAAEPVQALKRDEWQGGLTNDELRAALQSKLRPGFTVDDDDLPLFALGIEYAIASPPATKEAKAGTEVLMRATDMLTAYAELVKATGQYAEMHYIPDVEYIVSELRAMTGPLPEGAA